MFVLYLFVFQKYLYAFAEFNKCSMPFCKTVTPMQCWVFQRNLKTGGKNLNPLVPFLGWCSAANFEQLQDSALAHEWVSGCCVH